MPALAPGPVKFQIRLATTAQAEATVRGKTRRLPRILLRPRPRFYVIRLPCAFGFGAQPTTAYGTNPVGCGSLDRSPPYRALIDGEPTSVERVWTGARCGGSSPEGYAFRIGPLQRWARAHTLSPVRERKDAWRLTDGGAQWQLHIKPAEATHEREKELLSKGTGLSITSSRYAASAGIRNWRR